MIFQTGAFVPLRKLKKKTEPQANGSSQVQTELDRPTADEIYERRSKDFSGGENLYCHPGFPLSRE